MWTTFHSILNTQIGAPGPRNGTGSFIRGPDAADREERPVPADFGEQGLYHTIAVADLAACSLNPGA